MCLYFTPTGECNDDTWLAIARPAIERRMQKYVPFSFLLAPSVCDRILLLSWFCYTWRCFGRSVSSRDTLAVFPYVLLLLVGEQILQDQPCSETPPPPWRP